MMESKAENNNFSYQLNKVNDSTETEDNALLVNILKTLKSGVDVRIHLSRR